VGAARIAGPEDFVAAAREALRWDRKALVEPFVQAREIECSVIGNENPRAFMPGEIIPSHEFYDYEAKYLDPEGAALVIPAGITTFQAEKVREIAIAAYRACELSGMARVDFFIDRTTGEVLLNEVNTIPGFTHISMFPRMCVAGGLAYPDLIAKLGDLALERHEAARRIRYALPGTRPGSRFYPGSGGTAGDPSAECRARSE
jgi:D-alanine-D-alanine ligase